MATQEYWNVNDDPELWMKLVGHKQEDPVETLNQVYEVLEDAAGMSCLEIGAGVGRLLKHAAGRFSNAIGIDYARSMVNRSAEYLRDRHRTRVILVNGTEFPFADNSFDFVYSFTCFQHMPTFEIVRANLKEAFRVLAPNGLCRIQTVQGDPNSGLHDGWAFPDAETFWKEFEAVGFECKKVETVGPWIWISAVKPL